VDYTLSAPHRIALQEYGMPAVLGIDEIDLRALSEANARWKRALNLSFNPIRVENLGGGQLSLRAEGVTGIIRVGHTDIEIAPKFLSTANGSWQTVLWRILLVVEGGHVDDALTTASETASLSMPDLLAQMFLASYARGGARGLPRGYLTERASGHILRGSLDLSRLNNWLTTPWSIPYVADLLTDGTPLARLLRWTADCLAATVKSPNLARALREIEAELARVGRLPPHLIDAKRIELGAQHRGLQAAKVVGILLLEGAGVHHALGKHALSGFLWKSDAVYENYVYWLCGCAARRQGGNVSKHPVRFGTLVAGPGRLLETVPDVVFRDTKGNPVAVTDSKYKLLGTRPKSSDTYQVLTAGHVLGCSRVSLTYPVAEDREPTTWQVASRLGGLDIEMTAIPLNLMSLTRAGGQELLIEQLGHWLSAAPIPRANL
jgi:5-methylcytosine-specific restriction endonuclease McrBC regulatory subunit McrC